ncbi:MAG TPA: hypothetical protein VIN34_00760 [Candidatus Limnocylindria bacterium]
MLARLSEIPGVGRPEVDHRGELLRMRLDRGEALSVVHAALAELGYRAERCSEAVAATAAVRWYGTAGVSDLSREEAGVIAARVVPAVARGQRLDQAATDELARAVGDALYRCFTAHTLPAAAPPIALRAACAADVEAAAVPHIGAAAARALSAALWDDLAVSP